MHLNIMGTGLQPVSKLHPIIKHTEVLCQYADYHNVIPAGQYTFPFTLYLPDWLPQSHLCFDVPDPKKPLILNTFKVRYNLVAAIQSVEKDGKSGIVELPKKGVTRVEMQKMVDVRRITILTPEFSEPLQDQEICKTSKIKTMGLMSAGSCTYKCKFEKDVLYPNNTLKLTVEIDNTACSKKIEKYKIKLIRRTQVFDVQTSKPLYTNDQIIVSEKMMSKCDAK